MRLCEGALRRGVFAQAIRPPTVPPMTARLRLAVMATHREEELLDAARTLGGVARTLGLRPGQLPAAGSPALLPAETADPPAAVSVRVRPDRVFDFEASEPARRAA